LLLSARAPAWATEHQCLTGSDEHQRATTADPYARV